MKAVVTVGSSAVLVGARGLVSPRGTTRHITEDSVLEVGALQFLDPLAQINLQFGQLDDTSNCFKIGCHKLESSLRFLFSADF